MATQLYCSIADVQNRLSADGVAYRLDDVPPDDYADVLDEASREIDYYCLARYSEDNLADSPTVKHWAATVAAMLLCERRGNPVPVGVQRKYERLLDKLEAVLSGKRNVPDIAERRTAAPVMSNVRTRLDPFPRTVVERRRSPSRNQPTAYSQNADTLEWFDYNI